MHDPQPRRSDDEGMADTLYAMTVNPRRNAGRALKHLDDGNHAVAREYLVDVYEGLMALGAFHQDTIVAAAKVEDAAFRERVLRIVADNAEVLERLREGGD